MPSDTPAAPFAVYGDTGAAVLFSSRIHGRPPLLFNDNRCFVQPVGTALVVCALEGSWAYRLHREPVAETLVFPGLPPILAADTVRDRYRHVLTRHVKGPPPCMAPDRGAALYGARLRISQDGLYLRYGEQLLHRPTRADLSHRHHQLDLALARPRGRGGVLVVYDSGFGVVTPAGLEALLNVLQPSRTVYVLAANGYPEHALAERLAVAGKKLTARDALVLAPGVVIRWAGRMHGINADREGFIFSNNRSWYALAVAPLLRQVTEAAVFVPSPVETLCLTDAVRVLTFSSPCHRPGLQYTSVPVFAARLAACLRHPSLHEGSRLFTQKGAADFSADLPAWRRRAWLRWVRTRTPSEADRVVFKAPPSADEVALVEAGAYAAACAWVCQRSLFLPRLDEANL